MVAYKNVKGAVQNVNIVRTMEFEKSSDELIRK